MKPGIYAGVPNNEYHGGPGISKSGLDLIHRSPMHYKSSQEARATNDNDDPKAEKKTYFIGREVHSLILEPELFVKEYQLAFRHQDMPEAIDDRDQLVAMVAKLNETRLPKLATSGSKAEQVARILEAQQSDHQAGRVHGGLTNYSGEQIEAMKGAELKAIIEGFNTVRQGLLSTSGTRHDLAELLRANGVEVTLWSDVLAEWEIVNGHRRILTPEQWEQAHAMRDAVMAHPAARFMLTKANNVVVDLKTCEDSSLDGFSKSIANWRYDVQAPFYLDGLREALKQSGDQPPEHGAAELSAYWVDEETGVLCRCRPDFWRGAPNHFVFVAVEKKAPYAVGVYVLDDDVDSADTPMKLGRAQYRADLRTYAACLSADKWPGYGDTVQTIRTPAWHANKNSHLLLQQAG